MRMLTTLAPEPVRSAEESVEHIRCCAWDRAMCGESLFPGGRAVPRGTGIPCAVCFDLDEQPCERCGWDAWNGSLTP